MLTEEDFKVIERQAVGLYSELEIEIIQEIAERIANVGYANTVVYNDVVILEQMGYMYEDIIEIVARYNEVNATKIQEIFEQAGLKTIRRDDKIYKLAGLTPKELSPELKRLIERRAMSTTANLKSLTGTAANTAQIQFMEAINKAYLETSTGIKSYSEAIRDAVKSIGSTGAEITYPSGTRRSIESATRMNIITSTNQMSSEIQLAYGKELGWNMYEVSAHSGARPEHAEWQGKVYTENELYTKCGYGTATGLCGVNCRHTFFPFYKGSVRTYKSKELNKMENEKVEYNGKKYSIYQANQIQRQYERSIRENKKQIAALQAIMTNQDIEGVQDDLETQKAILKDKNLKLNIFLEQTGFKKDNTRLVI
jgi:C1A family cysteine protease